MISGGIACSTRDLPRRKCGAVWLEPTKNCCRRKVDSIIAATMSAKSKSKKLPTNGAAKRKGHLRSKVEKRDEDIIHVREIASIFRDWHLPDTQLRRTTAVLCQRDASPNCTFATSRTFTSRSLQSMFAVTHSSTVDTGCGCMLSSKLSSDSSKRTMARKRW
jgi:hypothetical protein